MRQTKITLWLKTHKLFFFLTTKSFHQSEPATKSKTIFYSRWKWISAIYRRVNFNFTTKYKFEINFPPWIVSNANKLAMSSEHYVFHYYCMLLCFSSLLWLHSVRFSCSLVTQLTENHVPISNETAGKLTVCPFSKLSILFPFYLNFVLKISNTQPCRTQNIIMFGVVFNVLLWQRNGLSRQTRPSPETYFTWSLAGFMTQAPKTL